MNALNRDVMKNIIWINLKGKRDLLVVCKALWRLGIGSGFLEYPLGQNNLVQLPPDRDLCPQYAD